MSKIEEKVCERILERAKVGKSKYGVTMEREDLSRLEWLKHAQEELLDGAVYLQKLIDTESTPQKRSVVDIYYDFLSGIESIGDSDYNQAFGLNWRTNYGVMKNFGIYAAEYPEEMEFRVAKADGWVQPKERDLLFTIDIAIWHKGQIIYAIFEEKPSKQTLEKLSGIDMYGVYIIDVDRNELIEIELH